MASVTLSIQNMSCASCVGRVEAALTSVPGVSGASVNLANDTAHVRYNSEETDSSEIAKTVTNTGYPTQICDDRPCYRPQSSQDGRGKLLGAADVDRGVFGLHLWVTLEMGGHMIPAFHYFIGRYFGARQQRLDSIRSDDVDSGRTGPHFLCARKFLRCCAERQI